MYTTMAFYYPNNNSNIEEEGKMAWDLRQVFAKDLVGETLKQIAVARKSSNFADWFKLLKRDLATEIYKNLDDEQNDEIDKKIVETKKIINKNSGAYTKNGADADEVEAIENCLEDLEKLMLSFMQKQGMFGSKDFEDDGL